MITERIAEHVQMANTAAEWLKAHGSRVMDMRVYMRRPLLEITCPPNELVKTASQIIERYEHGTRSVWVARFNDCQIIWR